MAQNKRKSVPGEAPYGEVDVHVTASSHCESVWSPFVCRSLYMNMYPNQLFWAVDVVGGLWKTKASHCGWASHWVLASARLVAVAVWPPGLAYGYGGQLEGHQLRAEVIVPTGTVVDWSPS